MEIIFKIKLVPFEYTLFIIYLAEDCSCWLASFLSSLFCSTIAEVLLAGSYPTPESRVRLE